MKGFRTERARVKKICQQTLILAFEAIVQVKQLALVHIFLFVDNCSSLNVLYFYVVSTWKIEVVFYAEMVSIKVFFVKRIKKILKIIIKMARKVAPCIFWMSVITFSISKLFREKLCNKTIIHQCKHRSMFQAYS